MKRIIKKSAFILVLSFILMAQNVSDIFASANSTPKTNVANTAQIVSKLEKTINSKGLASKTSYMIYVDLKSRPQMVYIFKGKINKWKLIKSFKCTGGLPGGKETVTGQFTVKTKGKWFFSSKYQQGGEYYTQFYGNYLFHGLPMNRYHRIVDGIIGRPASHGCIRLEVANAKWIYNYMSWGTKVYIPYAY